MKHACHKNGIKFGSVSSHSLFETERVSLSIAMPLLDQSEYDFWKWIIYLFYILFRGFDAELRDGVPQQTSQPSSSPSATPPVVPPPTPPAPPVPPVPLPTPNGTRWHTYRGRRHHTHDRCNCLKGRNTEVPLRRTVPCPQCAPASGNVPRQIFAEDKENGFWHCNPRCVNLTLKDLDRCSKC